MYDKRSRRLSDREMVLLFDMRCPNCNLPIDFSGEQTEEFLLTYSGICDKCDILFVLDRSLDGENLCGHEYKKE